MLVRLREQDVRRFDVAVDEPGRVSGVERAADLLGDRERLLRGERAALPEERPQARAVDVAHREVEDAFDLARVVDRDHVRVVERGGELRLAEEAGAERPRRARARARSP